MSLIKFAYVSICISLVVVCVVPEVAFANVGMAIRIRADGTVEPANAPIMRNGDVYVVTGDFASAENGILVERSRIIVDGDGHTVRGAEVGYGVSLANVENVTLKSLRILDFGEGVHVENASLNCLAENRIEHCGKGIFLLYSSGNTVIDNGLYSNTDGIYIQESSHNKVTRNNSVNNSLAGVYVLSSSDNNVTENYVEGNYNGVFLTKSSKNNVVANNTSVFNYRSGVGLSEDCGGNHICGNNVADNTFNGIRVFESEANRIDGNCIISSEHEGLWLENSTGNVVCKNSIALNEKGAWISESANNTFEENTLLSNDWGFSLFESSGNSIFHNNFVSNRLQVYDYSWDYYPDIQPSFNVWDDGYPSGGNYWSGFAVADLKKGPLQDEVGCDAITDERFVIDSNNSDRYPLLGKHCSFAVNGENRIQTVSNSTVSEFSFDGGSVGFSLSNSNDMEGFCRVSIPTGLMNGSFRVFLNGTEIPYSLLPYDAENDVLYFAYVGSAHNVTIVSEYTLTVLVCGLILTTLFSVVVFKRRYKSTCQSKVCLESEGEVQNL